VIPYIHIPTYHLGPLPIEPFGILVAAALVVGYLVSRNRARELGLDYELVSDAILWISISGFVVAHLVAVIFYFPERIKANPLVLIYVWSGLSSFGGFIGGLLGAIIYFKRRGVPILRYCEPVAFGLIHGWVFGRMGCATVHDHPGRVTDFMLAVSGWPSKQGPSYSEFGFYTGPITKHDLGLYELMLTILLVIVSQLTRRYRPFYGFHASLILLLYAPVRFLFDFLRVNDKTYLGLTPGQFVAGLTLLGALALGAYGLRLRARGERPPLHPEPFQYP
jgi:phosphatidylglycerol:prolipoprotein diacylglycerol transferase